MKRNKHIRCLRSALSTFPVPRTETILYAFRFNFICSPFTPSPKFPFSLALIGTELLHSQYRRFPARGQALALCTSQESLLPPDQSTEGNLSLMPETALKKKKRLPVCVIQVLKRSLRRNGHGCLFSIHLCLRIDAGCTNSSIRHDLAFLLHLNTETWRQRGLDTHIRTSICLVCPEFSTGIRVFLWLYITLFRQ